MGRYVDGLVSGIKDFFSGINVPEDILPDTPTLPPKNEPNENVDTHEVDEQVPTQNPQNDTSTCQDGLPCERSIEKAYFAQEKKVRVPIENSGAVATVTYIVKSGDTLSKIAAKYKGVSYKDIAKKNGISAPKYNISIGQTLIIPNQVATEEKIIYQKISKASLGAKVFLVVDTKGFKNGQSVNIKIYEKEKMLVPTNKELPFLKGSTQQTEAIAVVKIDPKTNKQQAVVEIRLRPKIDKKVDDKANSGSLEVWKEKFKKGENDKEEKKDYLWLKVSDLQGKVNEKEFLRGGELEVESSVCISEAILKEIFPLTKTTRRKEVAMAINKYCNEFQINTLDRMSHFLGQIGTETNQLNALKESYRYSEKAIYNTFLKVHIKHPNIEGKKTYKYHDLIEGYNADLSSCKNGYIKGIIEPIVITYVKNYNEFKKKYSVKAEYIKSKTLFDYVYGCRMGNGNKASQDGSDYYGVGFIHMTGKSKYKTLHRIWNEKYPNDHKNFLGNDISLLKTNVDVAMKAAMIIWEYQNINSVATANTHSAIKKVTKIVNGGYNGLSYRIMYTEKAYKVLKKYEK
jgi:predicted chitinase/LysM repeat protein